MIIRSRTSKRKLQPEPSLTLVVSKKLRSKLRRRRRHQISPVLLASQRFKISGEKPPLSVISVNSSSGGEDSCNSSRASVVFVGKERTCSRISEIEGVSKVECVNLLRNQIFKKRNEREVEVSESSCVDSGSGAREHIRSLISKFRNAEESKSPKENDEVSEICTKSEITCAEQFSKSSNGNLNISSEINRNDIVSVSSDVHEASFQEEKSRGIETRASESEFTQVSRNHPAEENCADLIAQSIIQQNSDNSCAGSDLACTEQLQFMYYDDESLSECYSSQGTTFSELHSEIFGDCSEFSNYTASQFIDSGSQFSEGSVGETPPSPTYLFFLQYRNEFWTLDSHVMASTNEEEVSLRVNFSRFEDLDDEDSYQMLRMRERRQVFLWNYTERYLTTDFGELMLQQRSQMVTWIVEQSCRQQLRQETLFLAISLLDRFLSKGYFKAGRNLQIVGIACLTLATRIEENQQYNRVGQKKFYIGDGVYSRCEVVAMEWMVQEVLEFQCFLPTIYNFLWFYLKAANADAIVEKRVKYLAVLALSAYDQLCYWPSTVAAALVILACLEHNQNASHKVIGIHVRSRDENLHECMESLEWLLRYL